MYDFHQSLVIIYAKTPRHSEYNTSISTFASREVQLHFDMNNAIAIDTKK